MSGARKKVVDVAFKASKNIDWEGMTKLLVSNKACKEFTTLRRTFDEVNSTLQTKFSQVMEYELDGIDWTKVDFEDNQECLDLFEKDYRNYDVLLLLGLEIGATPFIRNLRDLLNNSRAEDQMDSTTKMTISNDNWNSLASSNFTANSSLTIGGKKKSERTKMLISTGSPGNQGSLNGLKE